MIYTVMCLVHWIQSFGSETCTTTHFFTHTEEQTKHSSTRNEQPTFTHPRRGWITYTWIPTQSDEQHILTSVNICRCTTHTHRGINCRITYRERDQLQAHIPTERSTAGLHTHRGINYRLTYPQMDKRLLTHRWIKYMPTYLQRNQLNAHIPT